MKLCVLQIYIPNLYCKFKLQMIKLKIKTQYFPIKKLLEKFQKMKGKVFYKNLLWKYKNYSKV